MLPILRAQEGDLAAIRFAQILFGEDFAHRSAGDAAHVEHGDPVEIFGHGLQIMVDDDDRLACLAQLLEEGARWRVRWWRPRLERVRP